MSDVTLTHPVTGATKTVSSQKAVHLKEAGWTQPVKRKAPAEQDVPNVAAGRAKLAAENGSVPGKAAKTRSDKPRSEPEPGPAPSPEPPAAQGAPDA